MVATSQTLATQAGVDILKRGGSAVDAAIAANAMLALTEPHMCGPGGDLFAIVWDPAQAELVGLNGSGRGALGLSLDDMREAIGPGNVVPSAGPLAVTVPGAIDGWCHLHERFGRLSLPELMAPTVNYAREGVAIGPRTAQWWGVAIDQLLQEPLLAGRQDGLRRVFAPGGHPPGPGECFRNPALADTLEQIGNDGRKSFYEGPIGEALVSYLKSVGSWLETSDLSEHRSEWVTPLSARYRGFDVFELPPNGSGANVLQMLKILEHYPAADLGRASPDYWHAFIEAKKLAFEDRARFYADPEFAELPMDHLIGDAYAAERQALIDPDRAGDAFTHGDVVIKGSDTTYLTAADRDGMMVSLIQSIFNPFGSGLACPELGFGVHSRAAGFSLESGHPNLYAPGKRPFHTILPAFVMRDGDPWMSFGVMGADMQPQGQVQILSNLIDFGMDVQAAGDAPRMRHFGGSLPNGAGAQGAGFVHYEDGFAPDLIAELARRGHQLSPVEDWITSFVGGYQAVQRDAERGIYLGASEIRYDGCALGY